MSALSRRLDCIFHGHDFQTIKYTPKFNYQKCASCGTERRVKRTW
jgi:hypothetical protein